MLPATRANRGRRSVHGKFAAAVFYSKLFDDGYRSNSQSTVLLNRNVYFGALTLLSSMDPLLIASTARLSNHKRYAIDEGTEPLTTDQGTVKVPVVGVDDILTTHHRTLQQIGQIPIHLTI